jgi:hypothetical protein
MHAKTKTGSWYLKFTPTVPLIAPITQTASKTAKKYLDVSSLGNFMAKTIATIIVISNVRSSAAN